MLDNGFAEFTLKHDSKTINILDKRLEQTDLDDLFSRFYSDTSCNVFRIDFVTPTAFKKDGK